LQPLPNAKVFDLLYAPTVVRRSAPAHRVATGTFFDDREQH
jgi:hypothetical protein